MRKKSILSKVFLLLILIVLTGIPVNSVFAEEGASQSVDVEALFQKAMQERSDGDYDTSIQSFQTILSSNPQLHRARLELAVAYYESKQYQKALQEAEIVLNASDTPPDVRVSVLAFISQVNEEIR